jgi:hypothetical protein
MSGSVAAVDDAELSDLRSSYTGTAGHRFDGEHGDVAVQ